MSENIEELSIKISKLSSKALLRDLLDAGITKSLIKKYMPVPECCERKRGGNYYLFAKSEVLEAIESDEFKSAFEKSLRRSAKAKSNSNDQYKNKAKIIDNLEITINIDADYTIKDLIRNAIWDWESWRSDRVRFWESDRSINNPEIKRITENYIRHNWTNYDTLIKKYCTLRFHAVNDDLCAHLRDRVNELIEEKYPELI